MSIETEEKKKAIKEYNDGQLVKLAKAYKKWKRRRNRWMKVQARFDELSNLDEVKEYLKLQEELNDCDFDGDYSNSNVIAFALGEVYLGRTDDDIYVYMGKYFPYLDEHLVTRYRSIQSSNFFGEEDIRFEDDKKASNFEKTHTVIHPPLDDYSSCDLYKEYYWNLRSKYYETLLESSKEDADEMIAQYVKKK